MRTPRSRRYCRYPSTSVTGRACASSGFWPNSLRALRWRSRSQHWSSACSAAASRACSSAPEISPDASLVRSSCSVWMRSSMWAKISLSSIGSTVSPARARSGGARARLGPAAAGPWSLAPRDARVVPVELVVVAAIDVDVAVATGELPGELAPGGRVGEEQRRGVGVGEADREGDLGRFVGEGPLRRGPQREAGAEDAAPRAVPAAAGRVHRGCVGRVGLDVVAETLERGEVHRGGDAAPALRLGTRPGPDGVPPVLVGRCPGVLDVLDHVREAVGVAEMLRDHL